MMKDLLVILSMIGLFVISVAGTKDEPEMDFSDKHLGLITANLSFGDCFVEAGMNGTQWVVRNEAEYEKLAFHFLSKTDCEASTVPDIDFEAYSLLGVLSVTDCNSIYSREVVELHEVKQFIYSVNVEWAGSCDGLVTQRNWVLVPKIPEGYTVNFYVNDFGASRP